MFTILGAGLSGISASYHLDHNNCVVFEKNSYLGGHVYSEFRNGFTWDEGPHVSFTNQEYVKTLFADSVHQEYLEYPVKSANYFKGCWIPHPAQTNLFAVPQPIRDECLKDFLESRKVNITDSDINNYEEWLIAAFGKSFYKTFPKFYTEKYWTVSPTELTTDWVGKRVFYPDISDVENGYLKPLEKETHYISQVRYPLSGRYNQYTKKLCEGIQVQFNSELEHVSFKNKTLFFVDGSKHAYENLVVTIPLPELIKKSDAPLNVKLAGETLSCSSVLLINISASHATLKSYNWMYVYDEDKLSTRINCTELLSPNNAPINKTGIQVEVYFSKYKPKLRTDSDIAEKVVDELIEMGILRGRDFVIDCHTNWVQWANVIFDHKRRSALDTILHHLEQFGLLRNEQDLEPMTDWDSFDYQSGELQLMGRFAE